MMKKNFILYVCLLLATMTGLVSCGKKPINGNLDGRWQLMTIDYHENGQTEQPEYIYYDINLYLLKLWETKDIDSNFGPRLFGRFSHVGDSLHVRMIHLTKAMVKPFGMNDTIQHFGVESLTKKKMVLNSRYARLQFRKF